MLNEILDGITRALDELFGEGIVIYTDPVEQGLNEPCFFVQFLEPSEKPLIGCRYYKDVPTAIQYLPGSPPSLTREMNRAADLLMTGMEYITLSDGSLVRGTDRSSRADLEEKVLTFFVTYRMTVLRKQSEEDPMEDMKLEEGLVN